jgi:hypothetical protein
MDKWDRRDDFLLQKIVRRIAGVSPANLQEPRRNACDPEMQARRPRSWNAGVPPANLKEPKRNACDPEKQARHLRF